jgi:hypothetical protein
MNAVAGFIFGFGSLAVTKVIAEPLAMWIGRFFLGKAYDLLPKIFDELDVWFPQSQGKDVSEWLIDTAIPLVAQHEDVSLEEEKIILLADAVIKNYKLGAYLDKLRK